ncbi:hypothetical protein ACFYWP_37050 [Actinacidiphila glaucinigra]|uniref:hypothetical protein n=1 Tax=Actinacidiphila glaucinigra TaxID=235986 RepID=UPI00367847B4
MSAMSTVVDDAVEAWLAARRTQMDAAVHALLAAYPPLAHAVRNCYCCEITLPIGPSGGKVCVDKDCRATIDLRGMGVQPAAATLDQLFGAGWFDGAPDGLVAAEPGTYEWYDDSNDCEIYIEIHADGTADLYMGNALLPDAAAVLEELNRRLTATSG